MSFESLNYWLEEIKVNCKSEKVAKIICGNKIDLDKLRKVS